MRFGQIGAGDDLQLLGVGDVDRGVVLWRAFVRKPQDAPPILGQLQRHALAHAAKAIERMVGNLLEVPDQCVARRAGGALRHDFGLYGWLLGDCSVLGTISPSSRLSVNSATARTAACATFHTASLAVGART